MRTKNPITVLGPDGRPLAGAQVYTRVRASGADAAVYTTEAGGGAAANPVVTDATGRVVQWADRGAYASTITPPAGVPLAPYVEEWESAPGSPDAIDANWIDDDGVGAGLVAVRQADGTVSWTKAGAAGIADDAIGKAQLADGAVGWAETGIGAAGLAAGSFAARLPNANGALVTGVNSTLGLTTEDYDIGGNYDAPNGEFVVPFDGIWHFGAYACVLAAPVSTRWRVYLFDDKPGGLAKLRDLAFIRSPSTGADDTRLYGTADVALPAGARVEARIEAIDSAAGASLFGTSSTDGSRFWGHCLGRT